MAGRVRPGRTLARVLLSSSAAVLLLGAVAGNAAAAPAAGAAADSTCPFVRTLCLWDGANFTGTRFTVSALNPAVGTCVDLAAHGWGNGRAKSARNTASQEARLYTTTNCTGGWYRIAPGGGYGTVTFASNSVYVY